MPLGYNDLYLIALVAFAVYIFYNNIVSESSFKRNDLVIERFGMGPRGPQGLPGKDGRDGGRGEKGERGLPGNKGDRGDKGEKGDNGQRGERGDKGDRGEKGEKGDRGEKGDKGEKGNKGDTGERGERGEKGGSGNKGEKGDRGIQGDPGTFGENTCIFVGSSHENNWKCPDTYPIYAGASMGSDSSNLKCSGGVAKDATCNKMAGMGAKAKPFIDENGSIVEIKIISSGKNYLTPPRVSLMNTGNGNGFSGEAVVSNGRLVAINIIRDGYNYNKNTKIEFVSLDSGFGAKGIAFINNGFVAKIGITSPGSGYKVVPSVFISGGGGSGAKAIAEIEDGKVVNINVIDGGSGFTFSPSVKIEAKEAKFGCNYCHMCCKKNPDMPNKKESLLEKQIKKHEGLIQKLLNHTHEIPSILVSPREAKMTNETTTKSKQITVPPKQEQPRAPIVAPLKPPSLETKQYAEQVKNMNNIIDWRKNSKVTQSTTEFDGYIAIKDDKDSRGQKTTFSSTQMKDNSWWQIELETAIELHSVYIDVNLIENRESTLRVDLYNSNNMIVGSVTKNSTTSKRIINVEMSDIRKHLIIKKVRITCINPKLSKLAIYKVRVLGKRAKSCLRYEEEFKRVKEENLGKIIDNQYGTLNDKEFKKFQSLYESCINKPEEPQETSEEKIRESANKFREMMKGESQKKEKEAKEAKEKLIAISKQILKDEELAQEAKQLGVKPPPPMYSKKEIEELRKIANWTDPMKTMDNKKAAKCFIMYNKFLRMKNETEDLGNKVENMPMFMDELKEKGKKTEELFDEYLAMCS